MNGPAGDGAFSNRGSPALNEAELRSATMRKVAWRLIPFLVVAYLFSIVDRSNIGFASLEMNHELNLSGTVFGLAGGIYFIGYFLFEVPSNLALGAVRRQPLGSPG